MCPEILKIVRVKNRLNTGNRDIFVNLMYRGKLMVEAQLNLVSKEDKFIERSDKFNHYIYELKRPIFGPVVEMSCIWRNKDSRAKFYENYLLENNKR